MEVGIGASEPMLKKKARNDVDVMIRKMSEIHGAGDENRTHVSILGSLHSTIELRPHNEQVCF